MILLFTAIPTNADKMPPQEQKESSQQANGLGNGNAEKVTFNRQLFITVTSNWLFNSALDSDCFRM